MGKSNADQSIRYSLHFRFVELLRAPSPPCCPRQSASRSIQPGVCVLSQAGPRESLPRFRVPPRTCVLESKKGPDPRSASRSTTILRHLPAWMEPPPKDPAFRVFNVFPKNDSTFVALETEPQRFVNGIANAIFS